MRVESSFKKGFVYLLFIIVAIVSSMLYGSILESAIGNYPQYGGLGIGTPLWVIILVPVLITLIYVFVIIIGSKNRILHLSKWNVCFVFLLLIMLVYMGVIILTKDISHTYGGFMVEESRLHPTIDERIWSFFSFYLSLLTIYAYFFLIKPIKGFNKIISIALCAIIVYALVAIVYSLIIEWDKYVKFDFLDSLYSKPYGENCIRSFFPLFNAFGHAVYLAIISVITLAFINKKPAICLFSLILLPFIFYSTSRAAVLSTTCLFLALLAYFYTVSFKRHRILFYVFTGVLLVLVSLILIDFYAYNFLTFKLDDGRVISLKILIEEIVKSFLDKRFNLITDVLPSMTTNDFIFGLGYGISMIIPRTYDSYRYYMHNSIFEIIISGGFIYLAFIVGIFLFVLFKTLYLGRKTHNYGLFALICIISFSQFFYGFFESCPILFNDNFGVLLGVYLILIPNLYSEYFVKGNIEIYTENPLAKTEYNNVKDENLAYVVSKIQSEMGANNYKVIYVYPNGKNKSSLYSFDINVKINAEKREMIVEIR